MPAWTASVPVSDVRGGWSRSTICASEPAAGRSASPERRATGHAWREAVNAAVERLPARQREVFVLCHLGDHTPRDVSMMTGMRESTVRVHLFRAVHKLRAALGAWRDLR